MTESTARPKECGGKLALNMGAAEKAGERARAQERLKETAFQETGVCSLILCSIPAWFSHPAPALPALPRFLSE